MRLVAALPSDGLLLLERLDAEVDLSSVDTDSACEVIGGLLARLHVPAPPALPTLSDWSAGWLQEAARSRRAAPPAGLARRRAARASSSRTPGATPRWCTATCTTRTCWPGPREPWLAIDPQPRAGHPGWDLHAVLRNRRDELGTGAALRWSARHRTEVLCDAAGMDEEVARRWTIVRCAIECVWALDDGNADEVSFNIALAKALDD